MLWFSFGMMLLAIPVVVFVLLMQARRDLTRLRERLDLMEQRLDYYRRSPLTAVPPAGAPEPERPEPIPITQALATPTTADPAPPPLAQPPAPHLPPPSHAPSPSGHEVRSRLEEQVGGVWLQNVGSVLVLLGVFFMILWAYTTGRLGPHWLVVAGVGLGLLLIWRGDRTARALPAFGHALIGVGVGIVYLALYLGHFTLHVLPAGVAFGSLVLVSLGSVALGLHYRVPTVSALGVLGAFLPQLLAEWMPLRGFSLPPWGLIVYVAAIDAVVLVLAARAGWGELSFAALALTTVVWSHDLGRPSPDWAIHIAQAVVLSGFGLVLVPRLAALRERVRPIEIAVVALAPLATIGTLAPFLARVDRTQGAMLVLALGACYLAAALWAESRREDEDLWRPLTGAATLFLTVGLALALGERWSPVAWCIEGTVLTWLGLRARGGWLRACGYVVLVLGAAVLALDLDSGWNPDLIPFFYRTGIRNLVALGALVTSAILLARARPSLSKDEALLTRFWSVGVNALILFWSATEAGHWASVLEARGGRWAHPLELGAREEWQRLRTLSAVFTSALWTLQAGALLAIGWRIGSAFARWLALSLLALTVLKFLFFDLQLVDVFWRFLTAIAVGVVLLLVSYLYQRRNRAEAARVPGSGG